jgi:bifunctional oligoribonuclease and PAP phosphatase NrnA
VSDIQPGRQLSEDLLKQLRQQLETAHRVLVTSHVRPDGDAIGSLLGWGLSLQAAGKDVQMVLSDGVPSSYCHLSGSEQVRLRPTGSFDWVVVLDCSDLNRTGNVLNGTGLPDLNVDHHITNLKFAKVNLVDTSAVATSEILAGLIGSLGLPMIQPVAAALLTGIITDTIGFRTSNVTPKVLRLAADLMEQGGNLAELYHQALVKHSFEATRFWAAGLNQLERDGRLVWATLTQADRKAASYSGRDDADLINVLSSIEDSDIAVIFVEQPHNHVKVSWRAQPGFDVSKLATQFGGGGHPAASGAEIDGNLESIRPVILKATREILVG